MAITRRFDDPSFRYYSPDSPEQAIESHLRHLGRVRKVLGKLPKEKKGPLGLRESELGAIYREGMVRFMDSAALSDELRQQRQRFRDNFADRLERFRKDPDAEMVHIAQIQAVLFAGDCDKAIGRATREFADMLTQAVIARRARKEFSLKLAKSLWTECLQFANRLAEFNMASAWIQKAWGLDPLESPVPGLHTLETIADQQAAVERFVAKFRPRFEERVRMGSSGWLNEADNGIELRKLLSNPPRRAANLDDPSKQAVALLLFRNSRLTARQVCGKLDARNEQDPKSPIAPVPTSWRKRGARSWIDAYCRFPGAVKTFISAVRKQAGIAPSPVRPS